MIVVGEASARAIQALVRLDPVGFAEREVADRAHAGFPPTTRMVGFTGAPEAVSEAIRYVQAESGGALLGPVPVEEDRLRAMLRTPRAGGHGLVAATKALLARRSSHKEDGLLRAQVDPAVL